jgi:tetratricopeptide (TPR) repeat protein
VTLYEMLALRPAYEESDRNKLIHQVTQFEPPRLRDLQPSLPRDLETIVHKAIERDAAHRYPSALEFGGDLQRFLDDAPIKARRIGVHERCWRWCRRNPLIAALVAVLAAVLVTVSVASMIAAGYFNELARQEAKTAAKEREAREAADEATKRETKHREHAEKNFARARKAVDDYFTRISESQLLRWPGMQPLRRELLQSALRFYQEFVKERDDPTIRGELAAAFLRVGSIHAELGDKGESRKAFEEARSLYQDLTAAAPESVDWQHGLALAHAGLGHPEDAIILWKKLVRPGRPRFQENLANARNNRAVDLYRQGRVADALEEHQQALAIRAMLARLNPDSPDAHRNLGGTLNNIGALLVKQKRYADGLAMYHRAAEHLEIAFAQAPQILANGRFLVVQYGNIAGGERHFGRTREAMAAYRRVVEVSRKLARDNPHVPGLHSALFEAYRHLAAFQRIMKEPREAERTTRLAREVIDRLPDESADDLFYLACVRAECAGFLAESNIAQTAAEQAEQKQEADLAIAALRKAVALGFRDLGRLRDAAEFRSLRERADFKTVAADLAARVSMPPERLRAGQETLALRQKLLAADPDNRRLQADVAAGQQAFGELQLTFGKSAQALASFSQALALREGLASAEPNNARYAADLRTTLLAIGQFHAARRQWHRAAASYSRADVSPAEHAGTAGFEQACLCFLTGDKLGYRKTVQSLLAPPPGVLRFLIARACTLSPDSAEDIPRATELTAADLKGTRAYHLLTVSAALHHRSGRYQEAAKVLRECLQENPTWDGKIVDWLWLALTCERLGQKDEARQWLEKAESWLGQYSDGMPTRPEGTIPLHLHDWLEAHVLLREAKGLMDGKGRRD